MRDNPGMSTEEIMSCDERCYMPTFGQRIPIALERGEGVRVWDREGREYLDFLAGIAVNGLGHSHPAVTRAIQRQAEELLHCSCLYYIESQARLARLLTENTCCDRVFFANSGAEANEAAIKLARKFFYEEDRGPVKYEVLTTLNSFHGRTLATLAATGQPKFHEPFRPLPEGFGYAPFNDPAALEGAVSDKTCAIMLEPIQGESGVHPASKEYLREVRSICDRKGILLILDEIQTGIGRTGTLFAHEGYGILPDILTTAKGLGNGVPIGAVLARGEVATAFEPGDHGSTFGGNPLACSAALATLETILGENMLEKCREMGNLFRERLEELGKKRGGLIAEVRGRGLMIGVELKRPVAREVLEGARDRGLLFNAIGDRVLRFLPPLIVGRDEINRAVDILEASLREV